VRRLVIVDDDQVRRTGLVALLRDTDGLDVAPPVGLETAMLWRTEWNPVDVCLVDVVDRSHPEDHFAGVEVVHCVRHHAGPGVVVVVVTDHYGHDALRLRVREAGADYLYPRSELATASRVRRAVTEPSGDRRAPPIADPDSLHRLGVTPAARIDAFVRHVRDRGLTGALLGTEPFEQRRARWLFSARTALAETGRIHAVNADGTPPRREQQVPSIAQLRRVYQWATRVTPPV
jgi:hypothetical protein